MPDKILGLSKVCLKLPGVTVNKVFVPVQFKLIIYHSQNNRWHILHLDFRDRLLIIFEFTNSHGQDREEGGGVQMSTLSNNNTSVKVGRGDAIALNIVYILCRLIFY